VSATAPARPDTLTVISTVSPDGLQPDSRFAPTDKLRDWLAHKPSMETLSHELLKAQSEVDELLKNVQDSAGGMRLDQVQVGLTLTGEGSIGIASVGAQASLTLVYMRENAVAESGDGN
jgi:hypothetical protein